MPIISTARRERRFSFSLLLEYRSLSRQGGSRQAHKSRPDRRHLGDKKKAFEYEKHIVKERGDRQVPVTSNFALPFYEQISIKEGDTPRTTAREHSSNYHHGPSSGNRIGGGNTVEQAACRWACSVPPSYRATQCMHSTTARHATTSRRPCLNRWWRKGRSRRPSGLSKNALCSQVK